MITHFDYDVLHVLQRTNNQDSPTREIAFTLETSDVQVARSLKRLYYEGYIEDDKQLTAKGVDMLNNPILLPVKPSGSGKYSSKIIANALVEKVKFVTPKQRAKIARLQRLISELKNEGLVLKALEDYTPEKPEGTIVFVIADEKRYKENRAIFEPLKTEEFVSYWIK